MAKNAVLSLSGGMDSSTLLLHLLANGYNVTALGFDYGQKHKVELERAASLVEYLNSNPDREYFLDPDTLVKVYSKVNYQTIKLDGLSQLLNSALVVGGADVPEGHYEQDNMKDTVVPNRNKIFSSLVQAVALSVANETKEDTFISLGIHAGDHAIYPDCRQEFRDADMEAFKIGNWDAERVKFYTPYLHLILTSMRCTRELTLHISLTLLVIVTISLLALWSVLKLSLSWAVKTLFNTKTKQDR